MQGLVELDVFYTGALPTLASINKIQPWSLGEASFSYTILCNTSRINWHGALFPVTIYVEQSFSCSLSLKVFPFSLRDKIKMNEARNDNKGYARPQRNNICGAKETKQWFIGLLFVFFLLYSAILSIALCVCVCVCVCVCASACVCVRTLPAYPELLPPGSWINPDKLSWSLKQLSGSCGFPWILCE